MMPTRRRELSEQKMKGVYDVCYISIEFAVKPINKRNKTRKTIAYIFELV